MAKLTQARAVYKARLLEALQACKANAGNDGGLAFWQAELRTVLERQIGKLAAVAVAEVQAEAQERGSKVDRALAAGCGSRGPAGRGACGGGEPSGGTGAVARAGADAGGGRGGMGVEGRGGRREPGRQRRNRHRILARGGLTATQRREAMRGSSPRTLGQQTARQGQGEG